jgi:hypothetical protein
MKDEFITMELARIYESQGYFRDALDMYRALAMAEEEKDIQARDLEIAAGLQRMESALEKQEPLENPLDGKDLTSLPEPIFADSFSADSLPGKKINPLLEQWVALLMLEKRVGFMKRFGADGLQGPLG